MLLVALAAACSGVEPTPTTLSGDPSSPTTEPPTTDTTTTHPEPTTATLRVDPPDVDAVFPQNGASAPIWDDHYYGDPDFEATLAGLADAGADWVTLIPTWYQSEPTSSEIYREDPGRTTTDEALIDAIRDAQNLGLQVTLKPHVDLARGGARLGIEPDAEEAWFVSYLEMMSGYAAIAESEGVDQLVVGTELAGTSVNEDAWRAVIAEVRREYSGPLTYAANHDEFEQVEFWDALDFVGVDAYFPLADSPTTDVSRLTRSWDAIGDRLEEVAAEYGRMIVFTEVGYPSQVGATVEPYNPSVSDVPSEEEQAAALQSMLDSVGSESWFGGFHWWMWFIEDGAARSALSYMPEGKIAGGILEGLWAED